MWIDIAIYFYQKLDFMSLDWPILGEALKK